MAENTIKEHKVVLINRKQISITGVSKVNSVNESSANLSVGETALYILGKDIKMKRLLVEEGIVEMEGEFDSLKYGVAKQSGNFFKRIFK